MLATFEPLDFAVYHPFKVYVLMLSPPDTVAPALFVYFIVTTFLGFVIDGSFVSPTCTFTLPVPDVVAPLLFNVTVYDGVVLLVHSAFTVIFPFAILDEVIVSLPFFHPLNVYPDLVGVHRLPHASPAFLVIDLVLHPLPPLSLYFNVYFVPGVGGTTGSSSGTYSHLDESSKSVDFPPGYVYVF